MMIPSFPNAKDAWLTRAPELRSRTPPSVNANRITPPIFAPQSGSQNLALDMRVGTAVADRAIADELDLSKEALAFLLGAPPLAGSQENGEFETERSPIAAAHKKTMEKTLASSEQEFPEFTDQRTNEPANSGHDDSSDPTAPYTISESQDEAKHAPSTPAAENELAEETAREQSEGQQTGNPEQLAPEEQDLVERLVERDREVRTHEQAHLNAAGAYARGGPTYTYQKGPDGKQYAVGGEVQIDTSPIPNDPEATIRKAQIVRAAALAPTEPSSQDKAVASAATKMQQQAHAELMQMRLTESTTRKEGEGDPNAQSAIGNRATSSPPSADNHETTAVGEAPRESSDDAREISADALHNERREGLRANPEGLKSLDRASVDRHQPTHSNYYEVSPKSQNTESIPREAPVRHSISAPTPTLLDVRW